MLPEVFLGKEKEELCSPTMMGAKSYIWDGFRGSSGWRFGWSE